MRHVVRAGQRAFTLIELLIAVLISSMVLLAIYFVFVSTAEQYDCHLLLFPELVTAQLFATLPPKTSGQDGIAWLAEMRKDRYNNVVGEQDLDFWERSNLVLEHDVGIARLFAARHAQLCFDLG